MSKKLISSLARGLEILGCFSESQPRLTLSEISKKTGVNKTAIQRYTYTLQELGFLERDENKRYYLGAKVLSLGFTVLRNHDIRELSYPHLKRASNEANQTINLSILSDLDTIIIERIEIKKIVDHELKVGSKLPVYCSTSGKVIASYLPQDERDSLIEKLKFAKFTEKTITDKSAFKRELEVTKERGYSILNQELSLNSRSLGAPIFSHDDTVVAAVSIAVNASLFTMTELEKKYSSTIVKLGIDISNMLGWEKGTA